MRQSIIALVSVLFLPLSASAQTYDALTGWNPATNTTSNVWQYGTEPALSGPFTLFSQHNSVTTSPTYDYWSADGTFNAPVIALNTSSSAITFSDFGGITWPSDELLLAPGGSSTGSAQDTVLRWVVPSTGFITIAGRATDFQNDVATIYIQRDGELMFAESFGAIYGVSSVPLGLGGVPVTGGQNIDFLVAPGSDVMGLSADITFSTSIPEPASLGLLGIVTWMILRRRRKAPRLAF